MSGGGLANPTVEQARLDGCPTHGPGSLHVATRDGKVIVRCFSCDHVATFDHDVERFGSLDAFFSYMSGKGATK